MELLGKPTETPESVWPEGRAWDLLVQSRRANPCVVTFTSVDHFKRPSGGYTTRVNRIVT